MPIYYWDQDFLYFDDINYFNIGIIKYLGSVGKYFNIPLDS